MSLEGTKNRGVRENLSAFRKEVRARLMQWNPLLIYGFHRHKKGTRRCRLMYSKDVASDT